MGTKEANIVRARVSNGLMTELERIMAITGKTMSHVVRDSIEQYAEQDRCLRRMEALHAQTKADRSAELGAMIGLIRDEIAEQFKRFEAAN